MLWGMPNPNVPNAGGPRSTYRWDSPDSHARLVEHIDNEHDRTLPSRVQRAEVGHDRIARQGHAALARAGMSAKVVDPSFGENARQLRVPLHGGYELAVTPPRPDAHREATTTWHAAVNPPGVDYHVGGEEVHHAELGTFHPRDLHQHVQSYLGRPDVMKAMGDDGDQMVGGMERQQRNARRAPLIAAHESGQLGQEIGARMRSQHLGPQFGR